jgi:glycosyltransferase involved in cell wall biosynthesis
MYVGPSFFEGFQIPLIEALACGKPCVASHQPPASEIINAELGALVDPEQSASIAEGIQSVKRRLNDPQQSAILRRACRTSAETRWDYFVISKQEAGIYHDVINACKRERNGTEIRLSN